MALDLFFTLAVVGTVLAAAAYFARFVRDVRRSRMATASTVDRELTELLDRKAHLVEDLRDLELDYRMSKITEDEYIRQKTRLEPEAIEVLRQLDARGYRDEDALLEEELMDDEDDDEALRG